MGAEDLYREYLGWILDSKEQYVWTDSGWIQHLWYKSNGVWGRVRSDKEDELIEKLNMYKEV